METMWTLHVENFGRIESADIEVSPLTLFVGDNNSGKSYLLALIYGLMCADSPDVLSDLCEDSPEYQACAEWTQKAMEQAMNVGTTEMLFDDDVYAIFENLWNRILESKQKEILRLIFNADISAGKITLTFPRGINETARFAFGKGNLLLMFPSRFLMPVPVKEQSTKDKIDFIIALILLMMIRSSQLNLLRISFLPTARTGFLLTYPALAKDAFSRAYGTPQKKNVNMSLTKPCTDFLGSLTAVNKNNVRETYQPIVSFIERNIIRGKILVSDDLPLPEFYYFPDNMETSLPMFLSSDVVKEITPLVLTLQYGMVDTLFIEEPEMNLHPKLQQMMARVLIKLVNAEMPVFAATHSDTILQHINNMVKLSVLPKKRQATLKKRFDFDKDDLIPAEKISMYQFDVQDNGKTAVRKLSCGQYGFEIPTFYAPLEALLRQTQDTEPGAEKYED